MNTDVNELEHIKEILPVLSETALHELRAFVDYLVDRERRHKELVERVLKAEQEPDAVECKTPEEFIQAILNAPDDDDEG
jgi:rubrerythrin